MRHLDFRLQFQQVGGGQIGGLVSGSATRRLIRRACVLQALLQPRILLLEIKKDSKTMKLPRRQGRCEGGQPHP